MSKAVILGRLVSEGKQFVQLDATGKISSLQLPSYVDDVLEYTNLAAFPATGTSGIIYIAQNTNKTYRWSGSAYVEIGGGSSSSSGGTGPASTDELAEGTVNLYYTNTRSRSSLSFSAGGGAYNSTTGVITIPTNTTHLSNGSGYITANQPISLSGDVTGNGTTSIPVTLANSGVTAGNYSKVTVDSKGRVTSGTTLASNDITTALTFTPENAANRAQANGYASLDATGKVPSTQLPSYVDDVVEYANLATFPASGAAGIIYVTQDTNKTYRWTGSAYVEISPSPGTTDSLTEGSTNLYHTTARARSSLSFSTGSGAYNSTTGVITIPTNTTELTNGSGYITGNQTITLSGDATGSGTTSINITLQTVPTNKGGTGVNSLTANNIILGNGTSPVQFVPPGTSGNILTSNGTTWQSQAPSGVTTGKSIAMAIVFGS